VPRSMATKTGDVLKLKEKVVATKPMPAIPEGTRGKVFMVSGFEWIRYWVRFENGQVRGSIDRSELARLKDWEDLQARRARGEDVDAVDGVRDGAVAADASDGGGGAEASSAEDVVYNGVTIPGVLLERSKAARARLGK
jgi:hypothetical protein